MNVVEIEVDTPTNDNLVFLPTQQNIRGRFQFFRIAEPMANTKREEWGDEIPGQRIGFDYSSGEGYVTEPLFENKHNDAKRRVEKHNFKLGEPVNRVMNADKATWLYWMKRAVDAGHARVVKGALPEVIEGKPQKNFLTPAREIGGDGASAPAANNAALMQQLVEQNKQLAQQNELLMRIVTTIVPDAKQQQAKPK